MLNDEQLLIKYDFNKLKLHHSNIIYFVQSHCYKSCRYQHIVEVGMEIEGTQKKVFQKCVNSISLAEIYD